MRITIKFLLSGLFGLLALVSIGQGVVSLRSIHAINDNLDEIAGEWLPAVRFAQEVNTAFADVRIAQYALVTAYDEAGVAAASRQLDDAHASLAAARKSYEPLISSAEERALYGRFGAGEDRLKTIFEGTIRPLIGAGKKDEALAVLKRQGKALYDAADAAIGEAIALDVAGADAARTRAHRTADSAEWIGWAGLALAGLVAVLAIAASLLRVIRPIDRMTAFMGRLAAGDLEAAVPDRGRRDEIGAMSAAVQVFREGMVRNAALEAEAAQARLDAEAQRRAMMREMADRFETAVGGIVNLVSSAATEMQATASQLTSSAQETSAQSAAVTQAAEEAAASVTSVAGSAEELGSSIQEIGRQVERSAGLSRNAVREAEGVAAIVGDLTHVAASIGEVVNMISGLASQTNLLALNATIEAARAGEAGRGFAVVAAEVKELASQTAKATSEITSKIEAIQGVTGKAATAIGGISATIGTINESSTAIASAVEQQASATSEIAQAVAQASVGTGEVTTNITGVARAAEETGAGASQVLTASSELARQAETLRHEVQQFLATIRAA